MARGMLRRAESRRYAVTRLENAADRNGSDCSVLVGGRQLQLGFERVSKGVQSGFNHVFFARQSRRAVACTPSFTFIHASLISFLARTHGHFWLRGTTTATHGEHLSL